MIRALCVGLCFFTFNAFAGESLSDSLIENSRLRKAVVEAFPNLPLSEIHCNYLSGGYSTAQNYQLFVNDHLYVLRLQSASSSKAQLKRELYSFQQAAEAEIAPKIHWFNSDGKAFLVDYVNGELMTPIEAKRPQNITAVAQALRKVHALPRNPITGQSYVKRTKMLYEILRERQETTPEVESAMQKVEKAIEALSNLTTSRVTIHGDLNPRNIFITEKGIQFIDWSETNWEDPFYDLTDFALMHDLEKREEAQFLQKYLETTPTPEEDLHYALIKQINLIGFSFNLILVAQDLIHQQGIELNEDSPPLSWSFYTSRFADDREQLSAQFFYDWGKCGLRKCLQP